MSDERPELSFDGKGINGPDEYRTRLATFNTSASDADVKRYGRMFEASPAVLASLQAALELLEIPAVRFFIRDGGKGGLGESALYDRTINAARKLVRSQT